MLKQRVLITFPFCLLDLLRLLLPKPQPLEELTIR